MYQFAFQGLLLLLLLLIVPIDGGSPIIFISQDHDNLF